MQETYHQTFKNAIALAIIVYSIFVMLITLLKFHTILKLIPFHEPMPFNLVLSLCLAGVIVYCYGKKNTFCINFLSIVIVILSLLTIVQYYVQNSENQTLEYSLNGFDADSIITYSLSISTAICLMLFVLFIFSLQSNHKKVVLLSISLPIIYGLLGFSSLFGHIFHLPYANNSLPLSNMSLFSSIALLGLSLTSLLLLNISSPSGRQIQVPFGHYVFMVCMMIFISLWHIIKYKDIQTIKAEIVSDSKVLTYKISNKLFEYTQAIQRLINRYYSGTYHSSEAFSSDVNDYFKHMPSLMSITIHARSNQSELSFKKPSIPQTLHERLNSLCKRQRAESNDHTITTKPKAAIIEHYLCLRDNQFMAMIDLNDALNFLNQGMAKLYNVALFMNHHPVIQNRQVSSMTIPYWSQHNEFQLVGTMWQVETSPTRNLLRNELGLSSYFLLLLSVIVSLLMVSIYYLYQKILKQTTELFISNLAHKTLLNSMVEGVILLNACGTITFMNNSIKALFDAPKEDITSFQDFLTFYLEDNEKILELPCIQTMDKQGLRNTTQENAFIGRDNKTLYMRYSISVLKNQNKTVGGIVLFNDLSDIKHYENKLRSLAYYDHVTGLPNRHHFFDHLTKCLSRANRHELKFALCYIDIDHFKKINDQYGHLVGDKVLKYLGEAISKLVRKHDFIARLGGDEFCLILEGVYAEKSILSILNKIKRRLSNPIEINGYTITIDISIGYVVFPDAGKTPNELLINADRAMYHIKQKHHNDE